jgi:cyclic-di-AMP phosphodiesterase PgpH
VTQRGRTDRNDPGGRLALLSTPPERRWPDGFLHHGARVGVLVLVVIGITLAFPPSPGPQVTRYEVGMVADQDVIATIPFDVPKNRDELERERQGAAASVPPTYVIDGDASARMESELTGFFEAAARAASTEEPEGALAGLLEGLFIPATSARVDRLADDQVRRAISDAALGAVRQLVPRGVLDDAIRLEASVGRIHLVDPEGVGRFVLRDSVLTSQEFYAAAQARVPPQQMAQVDDLLRLTLIHFFVPSLRYDAEATEQDRDAARRAVPTSRTSVLQGEAIVRANQVVGEGEVERLRAYEEALRGQGGFEERGAQFLPYVGSFGVGLFLLGVFGMYLYFFRPEVYGNFRWVLLQAVLVSSFGMAGGVVARQGLAPELLPIAFVALGVAVLWDGRMALILSMVLAALVGAQLPFHSVHAWLPVLVGGAAAALSVRAVRRRSQTWIFIAIIAGAYLGIIVALGLTTGRDPGRVLEGVGWALGNAVISAILAMGFLPVFEWFTRITTDQTLLEWADPNRPLLKRLSMEAPGTYAHTINVVNLAEAAANAIGANGLLCRVGVYYHDVGKMLKPQYFIENQPGGRNPHDKLKPATSAAIVREHVTEGMRLAREANLPDVLLDFIPEHHGTQDIAYFLDRAQKELEEGEELDADVFRYPGPRPRSRETAIVMLADSVESATRTVQDPTPERIRELVDNIVDGKINAKQLDEAPLTLRDIGTIKEAFLTVLSGLYHQRIDYPQTRHITGARGPGPSGLPGPPEPHAAASSSPRKRAPRVATEARTDPEPSLFPADALEGSARIRRSDVEPTPVPGQDPEQGEGG